SGKLPFPANGNLCSRGQVQLPRCLAVAAVHTGIPGLTTDGIQRLQKQQGFTGYQSGGKALQLPPGVRTGQQPAVCSVPEPGPGIPESGSIRPGKHSIYSPADPDS